MFKIYASSSDIDYIPSDTATLIISKGDLHPIWDDVDRICDTYGCMAIYGSKEHCDALRKHHPMVFRYHTAKANCNWLSHGKYDQASILRPSNETNKHVYNPFITEWNNPNTQHSLESFLIRQYTNKGSVVFDPYGDWDIFRTAIDMERRYIGIQPDTRLREKMVGYANI